MTYRDDQDTCHLVWDSGLEIWCTVTSMAAAAAVERFDARIGAGKPVRARHIVRLAAVFVRHVERWNVRTAEGLAVPIALDRFLALHRDQVVLPVLRQWAALVRTPPVTDEQPVDEVPGEPEPTVDGIPVSELEGMLSVQNLTDPAADELAVQAADDVEALVEDGPSRARRVQDPEPGTIALASVGE